MMIRTAPVLVLQNLSGDGPAYLGTWLERHGIRFDVRNAEADQPYPEAMDGYAALTLLGGEMSANDDLPSLRQAELLILDALRLGRPILGHCLGGQLVARALGARVVASPAPEVGWQPVQRQAVEAATQWFGPAAEATLFHWHSEAFELPRGAVALAGNAACPLQAFAIGNSLAMQFHIELDAEKLDRWSRDPSPGYLAMQRAHPATVQGGDALRKGAARFLGAHQRLADRIYTRWARAAGLL